MKKNVFLVKERDENKLIIKFASLSV